MFITCPSCNRQLNVPDNLAGQQVRCPLCQATLQAPGGAPPTAPDYPPPADRRHGSGLDDFGEEGQAPHPADSYVQRLLGRGAIHLMIGGALFALMGVTNLVLSIMRTRMQVFRVDFFGSVIVMQVLMQLVFVGTPVVFMFVGAYLLRNARGRGVVLAAAILAIILASLCIFALLACVIAMGNTRFLYGDRHGTVVLLLAVESLLLLGAIVYGFIAGCMTLSILGRPEVRQAYGLYAPRRRRRRYDYDRYEHDRYDYDRRGYDRRDDDW
jgi:hypothetical protein